MNRRQLEVAVEHLRLAAEHHGAKAQELGFPTPDKNGEVQTHAILARLFGGLQTVAEQVLEVTDE